MTVPHILIVDDEENLRHMLSVMLVKQGYLVKTAATGDEALDMLSSTLFDFILCDIRMPGMDGREFLRQAIARHITAPIIMMTAYGTVETAVSCMQDGAYDFISKPFKRDEITIVLKKAEERERLKEENRHLRTVAMASTGTFNGITGRNPQMLKLYDQISRLADLKTSVLLLGESGTGKELVARAIHESGARSGKPFIAINCAAIPDTLLESELFGHARGAFTGAVSDKAGLFEQADGGTLLLDEIGEMPPHLQVKLLRVIQEGEVRRIGGKSSKKLDVRIVSATSRDIQGDVASGRFREDLFFRLNVMTILIPPLRERIDDIPLLAERFVISCSERIGRASPPRLTNDAMRRLMSYSWPGNVRELENVIERSIVLCDGENLSEPCLPHIPGTDELQEEENLSIKQAERDLEISLIRKALLKTVGNRTHAAKILEISHRALLYKMKEYGLE